MEKISYGNIFSDVPQKAKEELFETLAEKENVRVERIVSTGQSSPECFWYDQDENEFVIVLNGSSQIKFDDGEIVEMKKGDWLFIPAHKKHRVEETDSEQPTVWLAIFWK